MARATYSSPSTRLRASSPTLNSSVSIFDSPCLAATVRFDRMGGGAVYRVHAVKYAERDARRPEHFLLGDDHDVPMPMDYFVWVVEGATGTWVVDTGFGEDDAQQRRRKLLRTAAEA